MGKEKIFKRLSTLRSIFDSWRIYKFIFRQHDFSFVPGFSWGVNAKKHQKGFTLIELLVVIAMVGVMTSLLFIFINPFKQIDKARDAQRQADLSHIREALDTYYNDNNCYPTALPFGSTWQQGSTVYMKKIPQDPACSEGGSCYQYVTDPATCPQWNILFSKAVGNQNAVSCVLKNYPTSCLPVNYDVAEHNSCVVSGTVNCVALGTMTIPTGGGSQPIPTTTTGPTLPPQPTSTPGQLPTATPTTAPTSTPTPTSSSTKIVTVSSIAALKAALADNTVDEIVVVNGTYSVTTASSQQANSLWIGSAYAGRTRPILVRAQTPGGVTFNGGGAAYFGGISFEEGVHDQTWDGFVFANGTPTATGVIVFGGYSGLAAPHHITLRNITLPSSITSASPGPNDHGVYFAHAVGGPHDILIDGLTVNGSGGLDSAVHFFHSDASNRNAWNVTVRNMNVTGTQQAVMIWDSTVQNILIENSTITNASEVAVRYEVGGTVTIRNVNSTGSGVGFGFYSSLGSNPPQVTFINSNLN